MRENLGFIILFINKLVMFWLYVGTGPSVGMSIDLIVYLVDLRHSGEILAILVYTVLRSL